MINYAAKKLWGVSGGQLEYVRHYFETRTRADGTTYQAMVMILTDHDVQVVPQLPELLPGNLYEIEFPVSDLC